MATHMVHVNTLLGFCFFLREDIWGLYFFSFSVIIYQYFMFDFNRIVFLNISLWLLKRVIFNSVNFMMDIKKAELIWAIWSDSAKT